MTEAICVFLWARVSDSVGRKPVIMFGSLGLTVAVICFGFSKTLLGVMASRALQGKIPSSQGRFKCKEPCRSLKWQHWCSKGNVDRSVLRSPIPCPNPLVIILFVRLQILPIVPRLSPSPLSCTSNSSFSWQGEQVLT